MAPRAAGHRRGPLVVGRLLLGLHLAAIACWLLAIAAAVFRRGRARRLGDTSAALEAHRAASFALFAEHLAFVLLFGSGLLLLWSHGWSLTHARWLGAKVGLASFLMLPLECMHAFVHMLWMRPGLRGSRPGALARTFERGLGVEEMLRTLELVLFSPAVPLLVWLSWRKPF